MATKTAAVGSAAWISAEKENVQQLLQEEREELLFPAQHDLEWLNEHMAEIFSNSRVNMTNVFKTPGKLKGKTPRTNRKKNVAETRIPLSDVFSSQPINRQSPVRMAGQKPPPRFEIAQDAPEPAKQQLPSQTDSGYQGSSQIPADIDPEVPAIPPRSPLRDVRSPQTITQSREERARTTEGSFHSAKEDQTTKLLAQDGQKQTEAQAADPVPAQENTHFQTANENVTETVDLDMEDIGSPSDESTPDRPLVRKGSLNFASLPAREPLKTSIGARVSRTSHLDQNKSLGPARNSQSLHHNQLPQPSYSANQNNDDTEEEEVEDDSEDDVVMEDSHIEILGRDESEDESQPVRQYSKTATQRLHDKLEMLGKAPPPRTSKSIPSVMATANKSSAAPPMLDRTSKPATADDDDDWIKPLKADGKQPEDAQYVDEDTDAEQDFDIRAPELIAHEERMRTPVRSPSPARPGYGHTKSHSTATLASPAKAAMDPQSPGAKSISVSNPAAYPTTTPQGSPRKYLDLSASKQKLQSIMKTAKGLFTSSAGVSAAAKQEILSPNAMRVVTNTMPGMYPANNLLEDKPLPASPPKEVRKTRSSTEREKEEKRRDKDTKAMQKMNDDLDKVRQKEAQKAAHQKAASPQKSAEHDQSETQSKLGRPGRPTAPPAKGRPAPVSIKVGMQRMPAGSSIANSNQETLPAEPRRPGLTKKASNASMSSQSTTTVKASVHNQVTKPKALLAAERKKEQDEREAQRKLELKREMDRKRAAQQEQARKQQEAKRAEEERKERERLAAEQAKRQASQQAIEKKRQDAARKAEQQRLERERAAESMRPPSRLGSQQPVARSLINHPLPTNPAKPAKRPIEEDNARPPAGKLGAVSQQHDAKRRKTEDEEQAPRPTMSGAPIRQSNLGKKPSIFNHPGYAAAPQPGHLGQFPQPPNRTQPPQMAQYASQKIPFADAPNPPAQNKTPASIHQIRTIQTVKSSPHYPNGEQIHLPEIPTDSEDEDSEDEGNAFPIPDWATPGHLTDQLIRQEGMDGDAVFGPIAPLKMEEIFAKGNKERLKRLRDRTSSANWAMSGDGLTLEEVRVDREQRERMRVEGGWRYGNGN